MSGPGGDRGKTENPELRLHLPRFECRWKACYGAMQEQLVPHPRRYRPLAESQLRATLITTPWLIGSFDLLPILFSGDSTVKKNVAPCSSSASAQIRPPCLRIMRCTIASPTPVPSKSRVLCSL